MALRISRAHSLQYMISRRYLDMVRRMAESIQSKVRRAA